VIVTDLDFALSFIIDTGFLKNFGVPLGSVVDAAVRLGTVPGGVWLARYFPARSRLLAMASSLNLGE
jgi:hypothetical protein